MLNQRHTLTLCITLKAPFITQASGVTKPGLDALMQRDESGDIALPGTLIKGNLVHSLHQLADDLTQAGVVNAELNQKAINTYFGQASKDDDSTNQPLRGKVVFSPFWVAQTTPDSHKKGDVHYRIRIDESGTVKPGHIQMIEAPFASGEHVEFKGTLQFWGSEHEGQQLKNWINMAFELIPALGAFKGIGFGHVETFSCESASASSEKPATQRLTFTPKEGVIGLSLLPQGSFCFASHMLGNNTSFNQPEDVFNEDDDIAAESQPAQLGIQNRFESLSYMPASAIKGAMINQLLQVTGCEKLEDVKHLSDFNLLAEHISLLNISHAQPQEAEATMPPISAPLSLVSLRQVNENGQAEMVFDDILNHLTDAQSTGFYLSQHSSQAAQDHSTSDAPLSNVVNQVFSTDWKGEQFAQADNALANSTGRQGAKTPYHIENRAVQIHTQIAKGSNAAENHQLYSYDCVVPKPESGPKLRWNAKITLPSTLSENEHTQLAQQLAHLLETGLAPLGKTQVSADVFANDTPWQTYQAQQNQVIDTYIEQGSLIAVQLNSDALCLPAIADIKTESGLVDQSALFALYEQSIHTLSQGALSLKNVFAEQTLAGGRYLQHRFWQKRAYYAPALLTRSGSVFLCEINDKTQAQTVLKNWQRFGLPPLPASGDTAYDDDWQTNPYLNHLGFGHVHLYTLSGSVKANENSSNDSNNLNKSHFTWVNWANEDHQQGGQENG